MVRIHARVIWTLILLFALCSVHGASAGPPADQLRDGVDRVVKILYGPELRADKRDDERRAAISKTADEIFDFAETAKRSLGQHWAQRTPAEREEFIRLFTELVVLPTLVHRGGERLRSGAANQSPATATVTSVAS
jgi:phospholipid transport system substrate-binding protein